MRLLQIDAAEEMEGFRSLEQKLDICLSFWIMFSV